MSFLFYDCEKNLIHVRIAVAFFALTRIPTFFPSAPKIFCSEGTRRSLGLDFFTGLMPLKRLQSNSGEFDDQLLP